MGNQYFSLGGELPSEKETMHLLAAGNEVWFVGWGTLSLLNAGIAQGKNRSGLGWFLISLFLGPLATFLLVALFHKRLLVSEQLVD